VGGPDDPAGGHGRYLTEEKVPVASIVGLSVGFGVLALGLDRWYDGDDRAPHSWLVGWLVVVAFAVALEALRRRVIARGWRRLYGVLGIDADEIGKTGDYRSAHDPRRTARQRFIDRFSNEVDGSDDPPPTTRGDRIADLLANVLDCLFAIAFPLFPLTVVLLGDPAIDLVLNGGLWCVICLARLLTSGRSSRRSGTREATG
jgi:hypothetical protein